MSAWLETPIWWTGACVLGAAALLGTAAVIAAISVLACALATIHVRRLGNIARNLERAAAWDKAGRPVWTDTGNHKMRMVPTMPVKAPHPDEGAY